MSTKADTAQELSEGGGYVTAIPADRSIAQGEENGAAESLTSLPQLGTDLLQNMKTKQDDINGHFLRP